MSNADYAARRPQREGSVVGRYFSEMRKYTQLPKEREQELARLFRKTGDLKYRDDLVKANLPFVAKVASSHRNKGLPYDDLLNEGNMGLIEAATKYDPEKGTKFVTYAIWWINKSLLRALTEQSRNVKVPNYQRNKYRNISYAVARLSSRNGRRPDMHEIADFLDRPIEKIHMDILLHSQEISLDHKVGKDNDSPISDYLIDTGSPSPFDECLAGEHEDMVKEGYKRLSNQEKKVIRHRFGLDGQGALTLKEIGEIMKLSRERVRQIEVQAKDRLRRHFSRIRPANGGYPL